MFCGEENVTTLPAFLNFCLNTEMRQTFPGSWKDDKICQLILLSGVLDSGVVVTVEVITHMYSS